MLFDKVVMAHIDGNTEVYPMLYSRADLKAFEKEGFDQVLSEGWRFLGNTSIKHSISIHYDELVMTIPGRIRLTEFYLSKSQRKLLRVGARELRMEIEPKEVNASDERLFDLHKLRFDDNAPKELSNMVAYEANTPCQGFTLRVYAEDEHIATSFFHIGQLAADSSYCVYDPSDRWARYSLGHLTMLVEILYCIELGLEFYYVGYRYNVPSHFDYKANFFGLERYKCFKKWVPCPRIPPKPFHKTSQQQTDEI